MAYPLQSTFTRFNLTSEEQSNGEQLTQNNQYVLQNLLCDIAEEKLALEFDPLNPTLFAQREAGLAGQLGIIRMLLDRSAAQTLTITTQD